MGFSTREISPAARSAEGRGASEDELTSMRAFLDERNKMGVSPVHTRERNAEHKKHKKEKKKDRTGTEGYSVARVEAPPAISLAKQDREMRARDRDAAADIRRQMVEKGRNKQDVA